MISKSRRIIKASMVPMAVAMDPDAVDDVDDDDDGNVERLLMAGFQIGKLMESNNVPFIRVFVKLATIKYHNTHVFP